jgi:hypothetical protein
MGGQIAQGHRTGKTATNKVVQITTKAHFHNTTLELQLSQASRMRVSCNDRTTNSHNVCPFKVTVIVDWRINHGIQPIIN